MNIYSESIVLRAIEEYDNDMLLELINDPQVEKNLGGASFPISSFTQEKWFNTQLNNDTIMRCVVAEKSDLTKGLGTVILSDIDRKNGTAQIHIKLISQARGKGIGKQAVDAVTKYAFEEQRLNCIYAEIVSYNEISQKLFEKCGFQMDGVLRSRIFKGNRYYNLISYSKIKED